MDGLSQPGEPVGRRSKRPSRTRLRRTQLAARSVDPSLNERSVAAFSACADRLRQSAELRGARVMIDVVWLTSRSTSGWGQPSVHRPQRAIRLASGGT